MLITGKNKIVLGMPVFQDIEALKICFPSVAPYVDGAVVVDGAWKNYPGNVSWSTDGSPEFIERCLKGKACTIIRLPKRRECTDALNSVYQFIDNNYDVEHLWVIDWDCDWQLVPREDKFNMRDVARDFQDLKDGKYDEYKTVWMKFKNWRPDRADEPDGYVGYHGIRGIRRHINHYCIFEGEYEIKSFPDRYPHFVMPHSAVWHRFITRPKERILAQNEYYKHREEYPWISAILSNNPLTNKEQTERGYDLNLIFPDDPRFKDYKAEIPLSKQLPQPIPVPVVQLKPIKLPEGPPVKVEAREVTLDDLVDFINNGTTKCRHCSTINSGLLRNPFTFNFWFSHYKEKHPTEYSKL